jgi:hypothetical protein
MGNGSDLARGRIPGTGTGILHIRCTGNRRIFNGNRKNSRDHIRHCCDYHIPVWLALMTGIKQKKKNTLFLSDKLFLIEG